MDNERTLTDVANNIEDELLHICQVPTMELTMRQQQVELKMSCQKIVDYTIEIIELNRYLLERLKHSETERFSK